MKRREFIALIGGGATIWPFRAAAQQHAFPTIGFVSFGTRQASTQGSWFRAFHEGLEGHGWFPGRNLGIEYRFGDDDVGKLATEVEELVRLPLDAIVVPTRPALPTVRDATATIPIVFVSLGDPVGEGWVTSLAWPGGNLTGVAGLSPDIAGKRLELLRELVPSLKMVAVLWNPANSAEEFAIEATRAAAQNLGLSILVERAGAAGEFEHVLERMKNKRAQSVVVLPDPMFLSNRDQLVDVIAKSKLPAIYMESGFVVAGGLISYGPKFTELFRRAAAYVDRILKGAKPADMPVEQATNFVVAINLRTAQTLGLEIPTSILLRADEVIE